MKFIDYKGKRFDKLIVLLDHSRDDRKVTCKCDCGTIKKIAKRSLASKDTKSCGCIARQEASNRLKTHGLSKHRLYQTWNSMMKRCFNENSNDYKYYGGRGIKVCDRWFKVENFIEDMHPSYEEGLELDRIDNNGNYRLSNCKWSTRKEQCINQRVRDENNNLIDKEVSYSLLEQQTGLPAKVIRDRVVKLGWDLQEALNTPVKYKRLFIEINGTLINLKKYFEECNKHYPNFLRHKKLYGWEKALHHFELSSYKIFGEILGEIIQIYPTGNENN